MKKQLLFFTLLISFTTHILAQDAVLITINEEPIYQSEFEYIYSKNNSENTIDKKSLDEYMELFINFKLKVAEAKAQGIDTTKSFTSELAGYGKQLAQPYLVDNTITDKLIEEAYNRQKEDVEIWHIAIEVPQNATAADTLKAYNQALLAKERITKGITTINAKGRKVVGKPEKFEDVAKEVSVDNSVNENGGYIGWITPFRVIYSLEKVAYNTAVGEISDPVRSPMGYHLIKVSNRRPSQGEVLVSHIMLFTEQGNAEKNTVAKTKIDSIYQRILLNDDFAQLAKTYSEDRGSAIRGGELPWFGTGRMVPEFEKAAFALASKGDISEPIQSAYGWHIIKLQDKRALATLESSRDEIKRNIERDERKKEIDDSFINKLKKSYNYTLNKEQLKEFYSLAEQYSINSVEFKTEASKLSGRLFNFDKLYYTQANFARYLAQNTNSTLSIPDLIINEKLNAYVGQELLKYEETQLEKKYPEYRNLMKEYHDGILLFEISNNEVWERASKDTEGITAFFKANQKNYTWDKPHYKGRVIYCKDKATMKIAQSIIKKAHYDSVDSYLNRRLNDSIQYIKIEKGLYIKGENAAIDKYVFKSGSFEPSSEFPYVFVNGKLLKTLPESYTDVRGAVTADYQEHLEKEWIKTLRNKYKVWINEEAFNKMKQ